ncbi:MAG TPA: TIM barrel protein [Terriglobia bacterium]|nr:TIM barrel protein [Terriglobia bacterium]
MDKSFTTYRFSFGPWNISEGADPFGPVVREPLSFLEKVKIAKELGFDALQFHDDDAVPDLDSRSPAEITRQARATKQILADHGLAAEFVAPRLWFSPHTIDGAYTSNDPADRAYAVERSLKAVDIAHELGTRLMVLWLAREGTYVREAKSVPQAMQHLVEAINKLLEYDRDLRILVEPKPNEPTDQAYIPTAGHALALGYRTIDPSRMGILIETAHQILAGLDPSDEMGYALSFHKLWSVHLNDQSGLKFDEDKSFGEVDLRRAFNQVRVLEENGYGRNGEYVGLDVKAMRTQKQEVSMKHLANSKQTFLWLAEKVRTLNRHLQSELIKQRDYEELNRYITAHLLGVPY